MGPGHAGRRRRDIRDAEPLRPVLLSVAADGRPALRGVLYGKVVERLRAGAMDNDYRRDVLHDLSLPHPDNLQPDDADHTDGFDHQAVRPRFRVTVHDDTARGSRGLRSAVLLC